MAIQVILAYWHITTTHTLLTIVHILKTSLDSSGPGVRRTGIRTIRRETQDEKTDCIARFPPFHPHPPRLFPAAGLCAGLGPGRLHRTDHPAACPADHRAGRRQGHGVRRGARLARRGPHRARRLGAGRPDQRQGHADGGPAGTGQADADARPVLQLLHDLHQRRHRHHPPGHAALARPGPAAGAGQRQAPPPAGAGQRAADHRPRLGRHRHQRDPDVGHPAHRSAARRRRGAVRLGRDRRRDQHRAEAADQRDPAVAAPSAAPREGGGAAVLGQRQQGLGDRRRRLRQPDRRRPPPRRDQPRRRRHPARRIRRA